MHTLLVRGGKLIVAIAATWALRGLALYILPAHNGERGEERPISRLKHSI